MNNSVVYMQPQTTKCMQVNDTSRPLVFLGTNVNLYQQAEIAESVGIKVAGIVDNDYFGNTESYCDLPVIGSEREFTDPARLQYYKDTYNFFCPVTALPEQDPVSVRNYQKRLRLIDTIDSLELNCISIVSPHAAVAPSAKIGQGVFIDHFANIESKVVIGNYVTIFSNSFIAHFTEVERNCQFQRHSGVGSFTLVGENSHFSPLAKSLRTKLKFGKNTWIQHGISIMRGTVDNEIVSLNGKNLKRVYSQIDN